jgi:hypothetical protein
LKNIGDLQGQHQHTVPSAFGPLNTDRYERAFVDRIVAENDVEGVRKFDVYFLQDISGAPEQVLLAEDQSMVCMVGVCRAMRREAFNSGNGKGCRLRDQTYVGRVAAFEKRLFTMPMGSRSNNPKTQLSLCLNHTESGNLRDTFAFMTPRWKARPSRFAVSAPRLCCAERRMHQASSAFGTSIWEHRTFIQFASSIL